MCWEIFLDDASLAKCQSEQQAAHKKRMAAEGLPGYVDAREGEKLRLTLFQEARELARDLKPGQAVRVAPAGVDRKPTAAAVEGVVSGSKPVGSLTEVTITLQGRGGDAFQPTAVARLWPVR
jgi:hypothetical protein